MKGGILKAALQSDVTAAMDPAREYYAIGWGLDKLFHTSPWLTWIFTALGVAAAFVNLFRIGLRA